MTGAIAGALLGESAIPERWVARTSCVVRVRQLADALHSAALTTER
jgi:ADP-ribosylglycohydrolase